MVGSIWYSSGSSLLCVCMLFFLFCIVMYSMFVVGGIYMDSSVRIHHRYVGVGVRSYPCFDIQLGCHGNTWMGNCLGRNSHWVKMVVYQYNGRGG